MRKLYEEPHGLMSKHFKNEDYSDGVKVYQKQPLRSNPSRVPIIASKTIDTVDPLGSSADAEK